MISNTIPFIPLPRFTLVSAVAMINIEQGRKSYSLDI